jgi:hypothetical protein
LESLMSVVVVLNDDLRAVDLATNDGGADPSL